MWVIEKSDPDKNIPSFQSIKDKVGGSQAKAKIRYDKIKEVKDIDFKVSKHSVKVEDGKWWSKRKVAKVDKGVDKGADMLSFQSQDKGSEDYESGLRRVSDLHDGRMFYEPGVLDDVNVVEQDDVLNHTRRETSGVLGHHDVVRDKSQDVVRDKIQDTVQDESLNRYFHKRAIIRPKYMDDYVLK
ncbi:hypothetical protein NDU88_003486 [Pleurodeles waltl]|uniref:Uncharacterized protein n=1 Tax=Pleurodeles waltl TaxID=8319 RepID=A0AAV7UE67_PLEWA|nr:hypothetical protein NDU88_003486 [Pleurodeles waltl]